MTRPSREELFDMLYRKGWPPEMVASRLGVAHSTVRKWRMEYDLGTKAVARDLAKKVQS